MDVTKYAFNSITIPLLGMSRSSPIKCPTGFTSPINPWWSFAVKTVLFKKDY
jgi:hypothetical protein